MKPIVWIVLAGSLFIDRLPAQDVWALKVGRAHLGDGTSIAPAVVIVSGERIQAIGEKIAVPKGAKVFDLPQAELTPGFIDGASQFGLIRGELDNEERSEVTPTVRAASFVDLASFDLRRAFRSGTTTLVVHPGSRNVVGGQPTLVRTGAEVSQTLADTFGVRVSLGLDPTINAGRGGQGMPPRRPNSRMGVIFEARRAFTRARNYADARAKGAGTIDTELETLAAALAGKLTVFWQAESAKDIYTAMRIAKEFGISRNVIVGAQEAGLAAAELERTRTPVLVGPLFHLERRGGRGPRSTSESESEPTESPVESTPHDHEGHDHGHDHTTAEPSNQWPLYVDEESALLHGCNCCAAGFPNFAVLEPLPPAVTPERLFRAKAPFALAGGELEPGQTLLDFARFAVRLGLPRERAIPLLTSEPARFLGLADRTGSLKAGLSADIVVFDGDPLLATTGVRAVVSAGKLVDLREETKP